MRTLRVWLICCLLLPVQDVAKSVLVFSVEGESLGKAFVHVSSEDRLGLGNGRGIRRLPSWSSNPYNLIMDARVLRLLQLDPLQEELIRDSLQKLRREKNTAQRKLIDSGDAGGDTGRRLRELEVSYKKDVVDGIDIVLSQEQMQIFRSIWFASLLRSRGVQILLEQKYVHELDLSAEEQDTLRAEAGRLKREFDVWADRNFALETEEMLLQVLDERQILAISKGLDDTVLLKSNPRE